MSQAAHAPAGTEGEEEGNDFRPQHNRCHATTALVLNHTTNATNSAKPKPVPVPGRLATSLRRCDAESNHGRNIGIGQDVEHKGNGNAVDTFQPLPSRSLVMVSKLEPIRNSG